jgi:hypothetical protein
MKMDCTLRNGDCLEGWMDIEIDCTVLNGYCLEGLYYLDIVWMSGLYYLNIAWMGGLYYLDIARMDCMNWVLDGYLPTYQLGRFRLTNVPFGV